MIFLKLSLAVFFLRIVVKPWQRWLIWGTLITYTMFSIAYLLIALLQCGNPHDFLVNTVTEKCMSFPKIVEPLGYAHSTFNAVTDWVFAILPIFVLQEAQLPRAAKLPIICLIILAALGSISSCIRIAYIPDLDPKPDFFIKAETIAIWSVVEPGMGITVASLATLRPIFRCLADRTRSALTSSKGGSKPHSEPGHEKIPMSVVHDFSQGPELRGFQPIRSNDMERGTVTTIGHTSRERDARAADNPSPYDSDRYDYMHSGKRNYSRPVRTIAPQESSSYHAIEDRSPPKIPRPARALSPTEAASYDHYQRSASNTKAAKQPHPFSPLQDQGASYDPYDLNAPTRRGAPMQQHERQPALARTSHERNDRNAPLKKSPSYDAYDRNGASKKSPPYEPYNRTRSLTKSPSFEAYGQAGSLTKAVSRDPYERNGSLTKSPSIRSQGSIRDNIHRQPSNPSMLRSAEPTDHTLQRQTSNSSGKSIDATKPIYQSKAWPANGRVQVRYDPRALKDNMF